jgi:hypothetical protein
MTLKLKPLGANKNEITLADGTVILFSYATPVAAQLGTGGFVRTDKRWSVTTSKHITQWLQGANARTVPQSDLDSLAG